LARLVCSVAVRVVGWAVVPLWPDRSFLTGAWLSSFDEVIGLGSVPGQAYPALPHPFFPDAGTSCGQLPDRLDFAQLFG
jgi:hypothetical protein